MCQKVWSSRGLSSSSLSSSPLLNRSHFPYSDPSPDAPSRHPLYQHCLLPGQLSSAQLSNTREGKAQLSSANLPYRRHHLGISLLSRGASFHLILRDFISLRPLLSLPGVGDYPRHCGVGRALWEPAFHRPVPSASPRETKPQNSQVSWRMSLVNKYQQRWSPPEQWWKLWTTRSAQASLPAQPSQEPEAGAAPLFLSLFLSLSHPVSLAPWGWHTVAATLQVMGDAPGSSRQQLPREQCCPQEDPCHFPGPHQVAPAFSRDSAGIPAGIPAGLLRAAGAAAPSPTMRPSEANVMWKKPEQNKTRQNSLPIPESPPCFLNYVLPSPLQCEGSQNQQLWWPNSDSRLHFLWTCCS